MRITVIINPVGGTRPDRGGARARLAARLLETRGHRVDAVETAHAGHAGDLARQAVARGAALVFAWGGDGTVNEVGAALAFAETPLGIIPSGSGNGLARALGISPRPDAAITEALEGQDRRIDVGELGGRLFLNVAGVGLDALVARRFNARAGGRRGLATYVTISLRALIDHTPQEYAVAFDGERVRRSLDLLVLANAPEYGNGVRVAPDARLDDGRLDLVMMADARPVVVNLWRAGRLLRGTLDHARGISTGWVESLRLSAATPIAFHVDGEAVAGGADLEARVHPGALSVRVKRE